MKANPLVWIVIVAVIGAGLNYVLRELVTLPNLGNIRAAIGDGIMAALVAYIIAVFIVNFNTTLGTLAVFVVLVAIAEYFFHAYLMWADTVAPKEK